MAPWTATRDATVYAPDCANEYYAQDENDLLAPPTVAHDNDGTQGYDNPVRPHAASFFFFCDSCGG